MALTPLNATHHPITLTCVAVRKDGDDKEILQHRAGGVAASISRRR
jgi:hypothetical protein